MSQGAPATVVAQARHRRLDGVWRAVFVLFTVLGLLLAINQLFHLRLLVGVTLLENRYLYLLLGCFLALVFLTFPATSRSAERVPWYDVVLFLVTLGTSAFFAWNAERIVMEAWEFLAPERAVWVGFVLWLLLLEAARRTGGPVFMVVVLLFSLYPVVAGRLPGPVSGYDLSFYETIAYHAMGVEAVLGIPMRVFGTLFIGFILFGVALQVTGGGRFFTNLALALLGTYRGGAAKVAIMASALFGSMSGSAVSNVLSTGQVTIPTMIRSGFQREGAAAVEANASSGGTVMPPVMAATAFLMASILGVPYVEVAIAAAVPILLYFLSLFLQLDAYAAKHDIRGVERGELPNLGRTLEEGWFYLLAFALLVFMLIHLRREALAPFYATAALLVLAMVRQETRWTWPRAIEFLVAVGRLMAELVAILAAVGFLIGSLSVTGLAGTVSSDLVRLAGGSPLYLLLLGAIACFVLGMGMTITAAYVFLATTMAPALIQQGMNPMAVHLFILYWASLSNVTPPVGLAVIAAAGIAGARLMPAMLESVRFAAVKYALPFFFVYHPVLVLQDVEPATLLGVLASAIFGLAVMSYALQGYLPWVGVISSTAAGALVRILLVLASLLLIFPEPWTTLLGLGAMVGVYGAVALIGRNGPFPVIERPPITRSPP